MAHPRVVADAGSRHMMRNRLPLRLLPCLDFTLYLGAVATRYRHTRRGQHRFHVRHRAWDVDVAPRLTFAPFTDRTVAKAPPTAVSLH